MNKRLFSYLILALLFFSAIPLTNIVQAGTLSGNPDMGYELIDDGKTFHMWNQYDDYYFNVSSGIQITNHYQKYWTHNVMLLGYYNAGAWNIIYRTDELTGFTWSIGTDNSTYINVTGYKDLTYAGYSFRLAVRYCLAKDDQDLTVIPYIKNLGIPIPFTLGFAWEIRDIKIDYTYENDQIRINDTSYSLHQDLNNVYTNVSKTIYDDNTSYKVPDPIFYLDDIKDGSVARTLYLKWDSGLDYAVLVKSTPGQYNAVVTWFVKIGTLASGQEKFTILHWWDSDTLYERYETSDSSLTVHANAWGMEMFTVGTTGTNISHTITRVSIKAYRVGNPGIVTLSIKNVNATGCPTGADLSSGTTNGDTLTLLAAGEWRDVTLSSYPIIKGGKYAIVVKAAGLNNANCIEWKLNGAGGYSGGTIGQSTDMGVSWTKYTYDADFREYGWAITSPVNLTVSGFNNTRINLTWIKGADNTVIVRNMTAYPSTPYKGTTVYNGTLQTYADTGLTPSKKYYYRAWNWNGSGWSTNYTSANGTTRPNAPYSAAWHSVGSSINITWLNGTGSKKTVLRMSSTTQPILPQDGTEIYNGTLKYKVQAVTGTFYVTLFSFNTTTGLFSSPGVSLPSYFVYIRCYNESSGLPITGYSVFFTNTLGTQTYAHDGCTTPYIVNTTVIPQGNDISLMVNATGYYARTYVMDIIITGNYYINAYLVPISATLYNLRVISESNAPIEGATLTTKRYINATVGYQTVSTLLTDANGYTNIMLIPYIQYKVFISKSGYDDKISDYIPAPPNEWGQTVEKVFMLYPSAATPDMWNYITYTIGPEIFDHNTSFDVYFNISCPSGILEWFKMTVTQYNSTTNTWTTIWSFNESTLPTGGNLSYNINANGTYGIQCSFKLTGYDYYTFGVPGSGNKLIYTLNMYLDAIRNIDDTITKLVGKSPVFVGDAIVTYTALGVGSLIIFILFTFSPKFSGLGLIVMGMVTAWMKGPLNVISNATIGWNVVVIIIILGILVIAWTNMRETGE